MKNWLFYSGFVPDEKCGKEIEEGLFHYARHTYPFIYMTVIICEFFMLAVLSARNGGPFATQRRSIYVLLYGAYILAAFLFLAADRVWDRKRWKKYNSYLHMGFLFAIITVVWSCGITLMDQLGGNGLTVYSYMLITIAVITVLKPWQSFTVFGGAFAALNLLLPFFPAPDGRNQTFNNLMNSLFITSIAMAVSFAFNRNRIKSCRDRAIIEEQYGQLCAINERLKREVIVDSLTGLYNRRYLADIIDLKLQEMSGRPEKQPVACLMIDVDYFKQYNDTYGHQKGDECLVKLSDIIRNCFPMETARAVRYGGEEFIIFLFGCDREHAGAYAEKLRTTVELSRFVRKDIERGYLTVSIGIYADIPDGSFGMKEYISRADRALYNAKERGRNCVAGC